MNRAEELFDSIVKIPEAAFVLDGMCYLKRDVLTSNNHPELSKLAGRVFEILAWDKARQLFPDSAVLSPSTVGQLIAYLYSSRKQTRDEGGLLHEILPDGLLLETGTNGHFSITGLLEYKSSRSPAEKGNFRVQLNKLVSYEAVAGTFDLHDPYGRRHFAEILVETDSGLNPESVSLNRNYQVYYMTPRSSDLSRELILDKPESYFKPPLKGPHAFSMRPEVNRRLRIEKCDFTNYDFAQLMRILREEALFIRGENSLPTF